MARDSVEARGELCRSHSSIWVQGTEFRVSSNCLCLLRYLTAPLTDPFVLSPLEGHREGYELRLARRGLSKDGNVRKEGPKPSFPSQKQIYIESVELERG